MRNLYWNKQVIRHIFPPKPLSHISEMKIEDHLGHFWKHIVENHSRNLTPRYIKPIEFPYLTTCQSDNSSFHTTVHVQNIITYKNRQSLRHVIQIIYFFIQQQIQKIKTLSTNFDEQSNLRTFSHKRTLKCFVQVKYNSERRKKNKRKKNSL